MKLLFFIHSLSSGGAERVTSILANYWAEKGWEVLIVTQSSIEQDFYPLHPRVKRISLMSDCDSHGILSALRNNYSRLRLLRDVLKKENPRVVISMMPTANCLLAWAARGLDIISIGSERIHPPTFPMSKAWKLVRRMSYPFLDVIVAQTQKSADWIGKHAPARSIATIANPIAYPLVVRCPRLLPVEVFGDSYPNPFVLSVGRLDYQKGFDRLIHIFSVVSKDFPEWRLVILGEGSMRGELEMEVERLGMNGRIFLPGIAGNISDWYEAAEIFALTSRFEGFPNVLLEAMGYGLPVISMDCDTGPRDIVRHKVDGILVKGGDDSFVAAMKELMGDSFLRSQFSKRAFEVRDRFSVERVAKQWEDLIKNV